MVGNSKRIKRQSSHDGNSIMNRGVPTVRMDLVPFLVNVNSKIFHIDQTHLSFFHAPLEDSSAFLVGGRGGDNRGIRRCRVMVKVVGLNVLGSIDHNNGVGGSQGGGLGEEAGSRAHWGGISEGQSNQLL